MPIATLDDDAARLISALATRLCHDMAGLLGTLAGTLDLADEEPEAKLLASETATTLMCRVRLLRAAWGGGCGPLNAGAFADLAEGLPGIERLRLDTSGLHGELPEIPARLTLCLLLAALPGMPRGGTVTLEQRSPAGAAVTLAGNNVNWPEAIARCASSQAACWQALDSPRGLAAPLACLLAAADAWRIVVEGDTASVLPM